MNDRIRKAERRVRKISRGTGVLTIFIHSDDDIFCNRPPMRIEKHKLDRSTKDTEIHLNEQDMRL